MAIKCSKVGSDLDPGAWQYKPFVRLMAGVVYRAYADFAFDDDLEIALDGLFWLASEDAKDYCSVLGIRADPLMPLVTGQKIKRRNLN